MHKSVSYSYLQNPENLPEYLHHCRRNNISIYLSVRIVVGIQTKLTVIGCPFIKTDRFIIAKKSGTDRPAK